MRRRGHQAVSTTCSKPCFSCLVCPWPQRRPQHRWFAAFSAPARITHSFEPFAGVFVWKHHALTGAACAAAACGVAAHGNPWTGDAGRVEADRWEITSIDSFSIEGLATDEMLHPRVGALLVFLRLALGDNTASGRHDIVSNSEGAFHIMGHHHRGDIEALRKRKIIWLITSVVRGPASGWLIIQNHLRQIDNSS